jgi:LPXTG-site transpeptidase (sortase) family protein
LLNIVVGKAVLKTPFFRKGVLLLGLTILFSLVWYGQVFWNSVKPTVIAITPHVYSAPSAPPKYTSADMLFLFPRLGIEAPVHEHANSSPLRFSDWDTISNDLTSGVSLSYKGDDFTHSTNAFIVGHSSDTYPHPYSAVFAALSQAKVDDTFSLVLKGTEYRFTVKETYIAKPTDSEAFLRPFKESVPGIVTVAVVTCYPTLSTRERLVVVAQASLILP